MEKYKFEQKLAEAVIIGKNRQGVSVLMEGKERKARCHLSRDVEEDTPCLVSHGSNGYMVEAVLLYGKNRTDKEWFCINPLLFEHAVCYFLENHYMEDIAGEHGNEGRLSDARDLGFDFETKNIVVEIKILFVISNKTDSCTWKSLLSSVRQILKYHNGIEEGKRMILLAVCQHGTSHIQAMANGKTKEELDKAISRGIELWVAETKTEEDGINLLEYWNYTDKILKS